MSINRNNYESFFLMYTDNELSVAERQAVDLFVTENPDLAEELVLLQQSTLLPETFSFDKNSLLKTTAVTDDVQEQLIQQLHKELSATDSKKLQALIKTDAIVAAEFNLLQHTVLSNADTIIFEDKASLYRKELSRVVPLRWTKWAAAAMLIGMGGWFGLKYLTTNPSVDSTTVAKNPIGTDNNAVKNPAAEKNSIDQKAAADQEVLVAQNDAASTTTLIDQSSASDQKAGDQSTAHQKKNDQIGSVKSTVSIARIKSSKDDQQPAIASKQKDNNNNDGPETDGLSENLNNTQRNKTSIASVEPKKLDTKPTTVTTPDLTTDAIKKLVAPNEYALAASLKDDDNGNGETLSTSDEDSKTKRTKLGGFLRKVKRVVLRNTQLASPEPGDQKIKVANLEFAIQ